MPDPRYNCIRPECHYDLKSFDYYRGSVNPEQFFVQEEVVYDYFEDYDLWKHVESYPYYPLEWGAGGTIPAPTLLTKRLHGYGYQYTNHIGMGNPLNTWYSHTDLDIEIMKKIKNEIRGPIIEKVIEAKELEDKYKEWVVYNKLVDSGIEGATAPAGEEVTCKLLKEAINSIPLECKLIAEVLGEDWAGCDLNPYWWYGWLPTGWLESDFGPNDDRTPFGGTTAGVPTPHVQYSAARPPYQSVIGSYNCPDFEVDEETGTIVEVKQEPWFGAFGGYTADPCGCVDGMESRIAEPDYIKECAFPTYGPRYPEYLEYVRSIEARYWNTPLKTPLLRNAQLELLKGQRIQIVVTVDPAVRVGSVVELQLASVTATNQEVTEPHPLSGKWLVVAIKHVLDRNMTGEMRLTLLRDSNSKEQQ